MAFEGLTELLLQAAPQEMLLRRVGEALAQTSRQVNTLERRVSPGLQADLTRVRRVLEEREREAAQAKRAASAAAAGGVTVIAGALLGLGSRHSSRSSTAFQS